MQTSKKPLLKILVFFMNVYYVIFWICLAPDILHIAIWFFGLETLDAYNIYRTILGGVSFITTFLLTFLTLIPIRIITKIKEVQPFQQKFPGKIKWIVCLPVAVSILSLVIRLGLDLSGKLPLQKDALIAWAFATANSITSAACILQIRHFKLEMKKTTA